jgi:hypothetical protein
MNRQVCSVASMSLLNAEITEEEQVVVSQLVKSINTVLRYEEKASEARDFRDGYVADLRLMGWSLRKIAELTGYSSAQIKNISDRQGLISTRGVERA